MHYSTIKHGYRCLLIEEVQNNDQVTQHLCQGEKITC